jgi:hypothetical protein
LLGWGFCSFLTVPCEIYKGLSLATVRSCVSGNGEETALNGGLLPMLILGFINQRATFVAARLAMRMRISISSLVYRKVSYEVHF